MHRIDTDANVNGLFQDGDELLGTLGTQVDAAWLTDIQENLIAVLTAAGITPVKGRYSDLLDSVNKLIAAGAGNDLADVAALAALSGSAAAVVKVINSGPDADYWFRDPNDTSSIADGTTIVVDADGNRWKKQLSAGWIAYDDGTTIASLRPAEFGANITGNHTAANTVLVGSTAASIIESGSLVGAALDSALVSYGLSQTIADFVTSSNLAAENTSLAAVNVNDWNGTWAPSNRSFATIIKIDKPNSRVTIEFAGYNSHTGPAFLNLELEVIGNTLSSFENVSAAHQLASKGSNIDFSAPTADNNKWYANGFIWSESLSGTSDLKFNVYTSAPITGDTLFRLRFRRFESSDSSSVSYFAAGDTAVLARLAIPLSMVLTPLDNSDKDVLLMTNAPADAGATNRKTFTRSTPPNQISDDLHTGDLWVDTSDANKLYRWDGTSWGLIRDTGAAAGAGLVSGVTLISPNALTGVNISNATISLSNVTSPIALQDFAKGFIIQANGGFESGHDGSWTTPVAWFYEGQYATSRTQYYEQAPSDSEYGSSMSYGALTSPLNGGSVGWWSLGKRFESSTTGSTMSLKARCYLVTVGDVPDPIVYTVGAQTYLATSDAYFKVRCFRANGTEISLAASVQYSKGAVHQSGVIGTGHGGSWFELDHSFTVPANTFRVDVQIIAVNGGDVVRTLGSIGAGDAAVLVDDFAWSYTGTMQEVSQSTWAQDIGATSGATWGTNISGQPADEDLLNINQLWGDVSGTGKPANNATNSKTFFQSLPPANPASDINPGDIWLDTNDKNHMYRWNGTSWVSIRDQSITDALDAAASALASTSAGAITTYFQGSQPIGNADGDLWFDSSDNNKLYRFGLTTTQVITGDSRNFTSGLGDWTDNSTGGASNNVVWEPTSYAMKLVSDGSGVAVANLYVSGLTNSVDYELRITIDSIDTTLTVNAGTTLSGYDLYTGSFTAPGAQYIGFTSSGTDAYVSVSYPGNAFATVDNITLRRVGVWSIAQDSTIGELVTNVGSVQALVDTKITTYLTSTAPVTGLNTGDLWWDTSSKKLYRWSGSAWILASVQGTSDLVDDAQLGSNAVWANIIGTGKPSDDATNSKTFVSSTPPTNPLSNLVDGDIWWDTSAGNKQYRWSGSAWVGVQDTGAVTGAELAAALTSAGIDASVASFVTGTNVARSTYSLSGVNVNDWAVVYPGGGYRGAFFNVAVDKDPLSGTFKTFTIALQGMNGHTGTGTVSFEIEALANNSFASFSQGTFTGTFTNEPSGVNFSTSTNAWGPNGMVFTQTITNAIDHVCTFQLANAPGPDTVFRLKLRVFNTTDSGGHAFVTFGDKLVASNPTPPMQTIFDMSDGANYDVLLMTNGPAQAGATNSKTFAQGTDPHVDPSADLHVGDLWMDTAHDNKLYRWTGSAWVLVQDAGAAAGTALTTALADAGLGQSIADIVGLTNQTAESWPIGTVNVNDWEAAFSTTKRSVVFSLLIDRSSKEVTVAATGVNGFTGTATFNIELEIDGTEIATYTHGSTTLTHKPGGVVFGTDTNSWSARGIAWNDSITNAATTVQSFNTVLDLDTDIVLRLRIRQLSSTDGSAVTLLAFGDTAIASNINAPKELYFAVNDVSTYDVLLMGNAPAAAGADVTAPSITAKINYSSFLSANSGEIFVHGFNSSGSPADVDGYITYNGQQVSVPRTHAVYTSVTSAGYIYFDTTAADRFDMAGALPNSSLVFAVKANGSWWYDDNSTLVPFTPTNDDLVIGTVVCHSDSVDQATVWGYGMAPSVVSDASATNSKTFAASTPPSVDLHAGDIWIDTAGGNSIYRWSGSAWVSLQDSGAAAGSALSAALTSAGLGQDISGFVASSNEASLYSAPSTLSNVADWNTYAVPNQTSHLLHLQINKATKVITLTYTGVNTPSASSTVKFELEVRGNTVSSFAVGTFQSTYTDSSPGEVTFDGSGTAWGLNGIKVQESSQTVQRQATLTLTNAIATSTVFRLKLYNWNYTEHGYIVFGDTPEVIDPNKTLPTEMFFSPLDGSYYDVLLMQNAPAAAGADVTADNTSADTANVNNVPSTTVATSTGSSYRAGMETTDPTVVAVGGSSVAAVTTPGNYYSGNQAIGVTASAASAQVTNLLTYSQDVTNPAYTTTAISVTGGFGDAFGGSTAQFLSDTVATSAHSVTQSISKTTGAIQYTASVILKDGGNGTATLYVGSATGNVRAVVNFSTGAIGAASTAGASPYTSATSSIRPLGSDWYLASIVFTSNSDNSISVSVYGKSATSYLGDNLGVYFSGMSLITGNAPGRHVQTQSSSRTDYGTDAAGSYTKISIPELTSAGFSGKRVKVSLFAKQPSGGSSAIGSRYSFGGGTGSSWNVFTCNTSWQQFIYTFDVPVTATSRSDELHFTSCSGSLQVLVDSVYVEPTVSPGEIDGSQLLNADELISSVQLSVTEFVNTVTLFSTGADTSTWVDVISSTITTTGNDLVVIKGLCDMYADQIIDDTFLTPYHNVFSSSAGLTLATGWSVSGGQLTHAPSSGVAVQTIPITGLTVNNYYHVYLKLGTSSNSGFNATVTLTGATAACLPTSATTPSPASVPTSTMFDSPSYAGSIIVLGFRAKATTVDVTITPSNTSFGGSVDEIIVRKTLLGLGVSDQSNAPVGPGGPQMYWRVIKNGSTVIYSSNPIIISGAGAAPTLFFDIVDTAATAGTSTYAIQIQWVKGTYNAGSMTAYDVSTPVAGVSNAVPYHVIGTGTYWSAYVGTGWHMLDASNTYMGEVISVADNKTIVLDPTNAALTIPSEFSGTSSYTLLNNNHKLVLKRGRSFFEVTEYRN